ncbi:MAG TPA: transcription antitermination factor NusB [Clostridiales bacterium]|nr:transcription antitermination factor NusB [Clostridiales bacterium]
MTRTAAREIAVRLCFALAITKADPREAVEYFFEREYFDGLAKEDKLFSEFPDEKQMSYIRRIIEGVTRHREELDNYIQKYSKGWKLGRISKIAAAILRCAMYEILYMEDVPSAAAINEAVELAKAYEEQETVSFINGVLGGFVRGELEGRKEFQSGGESPFTEDI